MAAHQGERHTWQRGTNQLIILSPQSPVLYSDWFWFRCLTYLLCSVLCSVPPPQVCLCPLSGALRATFMPSRLPSTAWAITAKTWPSAPPTWRFTTRPRRETAGPARPPGVCREAAASAVSTTSPELPPCVSSALKVRKVVLRAQMASGRGAYLLLAVAVGGSKCNDTLRTGSSSALSHSRNTGWGGWGGGRWTHHIITGSWKLWLNKHRTQHHTFHPSFIHLIRWCHNLNAGWKWQQTDKQTSDQHSSHNSPLHFQSINISGWNDKWVRCQLEPINLNSVCWSQD